MVDAIICDIRMPKVNGVEAIDFFQQQHPSVPIIVLTGYPDQKLAHELLSRGVYDYQVKPTDKDKLLESVAGAMGRRLGLKHDH
jgi:YesN/AraC family two-component response regulator